MKRQVLACAAALCAALLSPVPPPAAAEPTQITMVSNWPDEPAKKAWVSDRVADFNAGNQQCSVKLTFTPKAEIFTQLKATLRTGHAPDIFYMEPDSPEFFDGGYLEPLDAYIEQAGIEDWARPAWTHNGKIYGIPAEAYTVELYYNKNLVKKLGVELPPDFQLTQAQFADLVNRAIKAGIAPVAAGVGDRPYPGAFLTFE